MDIPVIFFIFLTAMSGPVQGQSGRASVRTSQGTLLGREEFVSGKTVYSFRGIQYAESPTGEGRFRHSCPYLDTWSGTKPARDEAYPCPQPYKTVQSSEDCLHLSLWTPALPSGRERVIPVLVYLTGTLFTTDISDRIAPEDLVTTRDIVVVTVSSRMNVFGFLSLENVVLTAACWTSTTPSTGLWAILPSLVETPPRWH